MGRSDQPNDDDTHECPIFDDFDDCLVFNQGGSGRPLRTGPSTGPVNKTEIQPESVIKETIASHPDVEQCPKCGGHVRVN